MPLRNTDGTLLDAETIKQMMDERKRETYYPYLGDILGNDWVLNQRHGESFWECAFRVARMQYDDYAGHLYPGTSEAAPKDDTLYKTDSGLGGTFIVKIIEPRMNGRVLVKIHMPGNPDFHGYTYTTNRDRLEPAQ